MKRKDLINKLVNEGFNAKTLSSLNDKQIVDLSERLFNEQSIGKGAVIMKKGSNPTDIKRVTDSGMNVELREKDEKPELNVVDTLKSDEIESIWDHIKGGEKPSRKEMKLDIFKYMKKHDCSLDSLKEKCLKESNDELDMKEWISNLAETNYHSFTSKEEIMELIKTKLNESVKTIPSWFSSKEILANNPAPVIAPPKTRPGTTPKRRVPFQPGPGPNPRPDALMDMGEQAAPAPVKAPPKVKPGQKPKRRVPFQPGPGPNPRPDALMNEQPAPAPVKAPPKVKPGQKPKRRVPFQPGPGPNPRPDALVKEFKLPKRQDGTPINPLRPPYEIDPMRRFNEPEPEKQKGKPKKEEEKKKKDHPVPQEAAEQAAPAPVKAPPKVKPGQKPKRRVPFQPGPGPNPRPDALAESKLKSKK